jgi:hypothetical protein
VAGSLAERLGALLDEFAATDVAALPDEVVRGEVSALLTAAHRLDAVLAARLVSFDQRWRADGRPYDIPPSAPWTTPTSRGHPTWPEAA